MEMARVRQYGNNGETSWINSVISYQGGVPQEQSMLKGHLPRIVYHQVYEYTKKKTFQLYSMRSDVAPPNLTLCLSGRGVARAEDAQGTTTQSHTSPSILVYEEKVPMFAYPHSGLRGYFRPQIG